MTRIILESDNKSDLVLIKKLADRLKIKYEIDNSSDKKVKRNLKELMNKKIDISNFGDPTEWQKKVRKDRKII